MGSKKRTPEHRAEMQRRREKRAARANDRAAREIATRELINRIRHTVMLAEADRNSVTPPDENEQHDHD